MAIARDVLRACEGEILNSMASTDSEKCPEPVFMRLRCKRTPRRIAELRRLLTEWIEAAQEEDVSVDEDARDVGALIAFYPLEGEQVE